MGGVMYLSTNASAVLTDCTITHASVTSDSGYVVQADVISGGGPLG
jgi:hypothetical protein